MNRSHQTILVTGGCGFIGSAVVWHLIRTTEAHVVNVDALTYAGHPSTVAPVANAERYAFVQADIADREAMDTVFATHQPDAVMHLAAESHVDRSIDGSDAFLQTNVVGTHTLLKVTRAYLQQADVETAERFRFLHVSTDEVYGDLGDTGYFTEETPYARVRLTRPRKPPPTISCGPGLAPYLRHAHAHHQLLK